MSEIFAGLITGKLVVFNLLRGDFLQFSPLSGNMSHW